MTKGCGCVDDKAQGAVCASMQVSGASRWLKMGNLLHHGRCIDFDVPRQPSSPTTGKLSTLLAVLHHESQGGGNTCHSLVHSTTSPSVPAALSELTSSLIGACHSIPRPPPLGKDARRDNRHQGGPQPERSGQPAMRKPVAHGLRSFVPRPPKLEDVLASPDAQAVPRKNKQTTGCFLKHSTCEERATHASSVFSQAAGCGPSLFARLALAIGLWRWELRDGATCIVECG